MRLVTFKIKCLGPSIAVEVEEMPDQRVEEADDMILLSRSDVAY